jgi:large subunit ribosomal protein L22
LVKGKDVDSAVRILQFNIKKGSAMVLKLLKSAISNARDGGKANVDRLVVSGGWVNRGAFMKRSLPRAKGSATSITKRSAHITLELKEI